MFGVDFGVEKVAGLFLAAGMFAALALLWWALSLPARRFLEEQQRLVEEVQRRRQRRRARRTRERG